MLKQVIDMAEDLFIYDQLASEIFTQDGFRDIIRGRTESAGKYDYIRMAEFFVQGLPDRIFLITHSHPAPHPYPYADQFLPDKRTVCIYGLAYQEFITDRYDRSINFFHRAAKVGDG